MSEIVNNAKIEFEKYIKKWTISNNRYLNGIDVGCGTCRIDDMIISIDAQPDYRYAHAQLVWNCINLDIFANKQLDFIFSSHCLEDFIDIQAVFLNWWEKLKVNGLMLLLLPDMELCECQYCKGKSRYPRIGEGGNPSHRTNVGKKYITDLLTTLHERSQIDSEILQCDSIPHNETCSIDFVIKKLK
jgi:predicted SAM-dependent methyltransferase